jgi:hypothetical protein
MYLVFQITSFEPMQNMQFHEFQELNLVDFDHHLC